MNWSFVNKAISHFGVKLVRLKMHNQIPPGNVYALDASTNNNIDIEIRKLLNLLSYTRINATSYSAKDYPSGYHTLRIDGHEFAGQRDPEQRLKDVPFNFDRATVLDLGCNQGGMLLAIADRVRAAVGVDFDHKMINAATRIKAHRGLGNLNFFVFDLEKENLDLLRNFYSGTSVDIVFLLSVCMWIKNWTAVIDAARSMSANLLFESNGSDQQQNEQQAYLRSTYASVIVVREASSDDSGQQRRRLFLCQAETPDLGRADSVHEH